MGKAKAQIHNFLLVTSTVLLPVGQAVSSQCSKMCDILERPQFSSAAQLCPTLWPHGLQHARLTCPSPTPRVYSNSCPLSWWCHPTISSLVNHFSCLQSFPASGSFPMSQFFTSGGQSRSFSFSISSSNEYSGLISLRMDWLDLLAVQGTLQSLLQHHSSKASILWGSAFFLVQLSYPYIDHWKNHSFD